MWMDTHPEGRQRITERDRTSKDSSDEVNASPVGPHVVVIGASHAGVSFADRLRKMVLWAIYRYSTNKLVGQWSVHLFQRGSSGWR